MYKYIFLFSFLIVAVGCNFQENNTQPEAVNTAVETSPNFGLAIHGGAGTILKAQMSDSLEKAYREVLTAAIETGHKILNDGGTALEAVTKTINILEDSPLFNAGKGAVFTFEETNELDASIMDGSNLNAGAVSGVTRIKNPIDLARAVMEQSPHVFLSGKGAETFAASVGIPFINPEYFYTERRFKALQRVKNASQATRFDPFIKDSKFGTVGCVALDKNGNLAAGTSTGGMTNKRWNRIGDSPIIGSGTYANNATCAVSSTGWGEFFIRAQVAHDISALMAYKGLTVQEAARVVIQEKVPALGGDGGIIAIDNKGNVALEFNTAGMYRAHMNAKGDLKVAIYKD